VPYQQLVVSLVANLSQLKETCEKVLIAAHSDLMWDEFQSLLDGDRSDGAHTQINGEGVIADHPCQTSRGCTAS
jgi:hypothetical protein